jgi:ammonia channel protein AmtB
MSLGHTSGHDETVVALASEGRAQEVAPSTARRVRRLTMVAKWLMGLLAGLVAAVPAGLTVAQVAGVGAGLLAGAVTVLVSGGLVVLQLSAGRNA